MALIKKKKTKTAAARDYVAEKYQPSPCMINN